VCAALGFVPRSRRVFCRRAPPTIRNFAPLFPVGLTRSLFPQVLNKYHDTPFHNYQHAFHVFHNCMLFLSSIPDLRDCFTSLDAFSLLVAALCHDMDHTGAPYDAKVANRNGRDFGWAIAHGAVSRRPPISLYTIVARTRMYTYDAQVWDFSLVQGPFAVAPCPRRLLTARGLHVSPPQGPTTPTTSTRGRSWPCGTTT
jgi:hypothetical protein